MINCIRQHLKANRRLSILHDKPNPMRNSEIIERKMMVKLYFLRANKIITIFKTYKEISVAIGAHVENDGTIVEWISVDTVRFVSLHQSNKYSIKNES